MPPGIENLQAEFGAMGYTNNDKLVNGGRQYSNSSRAVPARGPNNLLYLRGERFTDKHANDPTFTPPYQLQVATRASTQES